MDEARNVDEIVRPTLGQDTEFAWISKSHINALRLHLLLIAIWMLSSPLEGGALAQEAPSFDCVAAKTSVEHLVCNDGSGDLQRMDRKLSEVFLRKKRLTKSAFVPELINEQNVWLKKIELDCQSPVGDLSETVKYKKCIIDEYEKRIAYLQGNSNDFVVDMPSGYDPKHVILLYSGDDKLCYPLGKLYNELNHTHKVPRHEKFGWSNYWVWEESEVARFREIGLVEPPRLGKGYPERYGGYGDFYGAYKLPVGKGGQKVIVGVEDISWDRFTASTIFVFNPDIPPSVFLDRLFEDSQKPELENTTDLVSLEIFGRFGAEKSGAIYPKINLDYFFTKNDTKTAYVYVENLDNKKFYVKRTGSDIGLFKNAPLIQRAYVMNGQIIFSARQFGTALLYKIRDGSFIEDLCYFSDHVTNAPLKGIK